MLRSNTQKKMTGVIYVILLNDLNHGFKHLLLLEQGKGSFENLSYPWLRFSKPPDRKIKRNINCIREFLLNS